MVDAVDVDVEIVGSADEVKNRIDAELTEFKWVRNSLDNTSNLYVLTGKCTSINFRL